MTCKMCGLEHHEFTVEDVMDAFPAMVEVAMTRKPVDRELQSEFLAKLDALAALIANGGGE